MTAARCPGEGGGRRNLPPNVITGDLFPDSIPPVRPAIWPKPGSRADEALQALLRGPITQAEHYSSWRLAASIKALRYDGWGICSRLVTHAGCRTPIAEYSLNRADPATSAALESRGR